MTAASTPNRTSARRVLAAVVIPVTVLLLASACSSSKSSSPAPVGGGGSTASTGNTGASSSTGASMVEVKNFSFMPKDLTVAVGTKVTWKFDDSAAHTVKAADNSFSSPALSNGKTFDFTFNKAGTYSYICTIHQYMTGTITVK
ncbi:MAG: cupredoxin family copper-binding protein [Actinomycetota bacterium]|nr:cupredoxin family copper-binding protein [Actinomycetota bacterium]MDQ2956466.1 cupredoxin family copper-binding protein [Actinomycetota bacterium]